MGNYIDLIAIIIATLALGISFFSWRASTQANRAMIYDKRYENMENRRL